MISNVQDDLLSTTVINYQNEACGFSESLRMSKIMVYSDLSPLESPLCLGSYGLARLAKPKDKTTSNHFGISGSSPPRSREGSLYKGKEIYIFEVQFKVLG